MKKKLTTILAMCLCAILTLTAINPATTYAADNYTKIKVKYKGETMTFKVNMDKKGIEKVKVKTLKKKWGKPDIIDENEITDLYNWQKTETTWIQYRNNHLNHIWGGLNAYVNNKSVSVCGIKVGMKASKASKILKALGFPIFEKEKTYIRTGFDDYETIEIICRTKNGKVTNIECNAFHCAE